MLQLADLYQELILDHNRRPRHRCRLSCPSHQAAGDNPLCGDRITVFLRVSDGLVEEASFEGEGCALCIASCSLMTEAIQGRSVSEAKRLFEGFHSLLTGDGENKDVELGKLEAFSGVREFPVRVKCATLPWHTLSAALARQPSVRIDP